MEKIEQACLKLRRTKAMCDQYEKEYENARQVLLSLTGDNEFAGHGVKVSHIPGRSYTDWDLVKAAMNISDEQIKPFTKTKPDTVRVTVERTIVI